MFSSSAQWRIFRVSTALMFRRSPFHQFGAKSLQSWCSSLTFELRWVKSGCAWCSKRLIWEPWSDNSSAARSCHFLSAGLLSDVVGTVVGSALTSIVPCFICSEAGLGRAYYSSIMSLSFKAASNLQPCALNAEILKYFNTSEEAT